MAHQLPVEIVGRIIQALYHSSGSKYPPSALLDLLLVSPTFHAETERQIYSYIYLKSTSQVVKCFTTLCKRPLLARYTRGLSISLPLNFKSEPLATLELFGLALQAVRSSRCTGCVMKPFGDLVARALNLMSNLVDYSLSLGGLPNREERVFAPVWLPTAAPFRLRRFIVDLGMSSAMAAFLVSQPSIVELMVPRFVAYPNRQPLPPTALPRLRSLLANSLMAAVLVPKRPLRKVALKDNGRGRQALPAQLLPELAKSSASVRHFDTTISSVTNVVEFLWPHLTVNLPKLDTIVLRCGSPIVEKVYEIYLSDAFCAPLSSFSKLRHLVLPAPHSFHHLRNAGFAPQVGSQSIAIHANWIVTAADDPADGLGNVGTALGNIFGNLDAAANANANGTAPIFFGPPLPPPPMPTAPPANTVPFGPPPPPGPALPGPQPNTAGLPLFLQQIFQGPGVVATAHVPNDPQPAGAPPPNPNNQPPLEPLHPPAWVMDQTIVIQSVPPPVAENVPQLQQNPPVPAPTPVNDANTPPPADAGAEQGALHALGAQIQTATNAIMNMITQTQLNMTNLQNDLANTQVNIDQVANGLENLEGVAVDAAAVLGNLGQPDAAADGVPPPAEPEQDPFVFDEDVALQVPFFNGHIPINTAIFGLVPGGPGDDGAPPHRRRMPSPHPKQDEILDKGMKELREKELSILEKWKQGGFIPNLKSVSFDMDNSRRTTWTWKETSPGSSTFAAIGDSDDDGGETTSGRASGSWEVEYTRK